MCLVTGPITLTTSLEFWVCGPTHVPHIGQHLGVAVGGIEPVVGGGARLVAHVMFVTRQLKGSVWAGYLTLIDAKQRTAIDRVPFQDGRWRSHKRFAQNL